MASPPASNEPVPYEADSVHHHRGNIADVRGDGFIADGFGRMAIAKEVSILCDQVRAKDERVAGGKIEDCGIVADADGQFIRLWTKSLADVTD